MHHKTLQPGDANFYVSNLTFYAGEPQTERFVHHDWGSPDWEALVAQTAKSHIFNVAFGLSDLANSPDPVEDSLFGNLVA